MDESDGSQDSLIKHRHLWATYSPKRHKKDKKSDGRKQPGNLYRTYGTRVIPSVQAFASQYLKTPLGEPVKGKKKKTNTELWIEKFYKKTTNLPEPFPHELVERLEQYLDNLEEQLVDLSSLLYDHRLEDAHLNSSEILQSTIFTQQYVDRVLVTEREKMRCCDIEYKVPVQSSQAFIYGGILIAGFLVYFLVIFFSSLLYADQILCEMMDLCEFFFCLYYERVISMELPSAAHSQLEMANRSFVHRKP